MKSTDIIKPTPLIAPIANDGLKNTIPDDATGSNYASIAEGFPEMTMKAPKDGGLPPWGQDFNGMFYLMSSQTCFLQNGGLITFDDDVSNKIGGYPQDAILDYITPGNSYVKVKSLIDDNTYNFVTDPSHIDGEHWEEITIAATTSWGDITGTITNQTDLTDYVNQSKALETGSVSSDADVYADVLKYAHSTFDLSKFTVVGSPNITDDGIASGFSTANYITTSSSFNFASAQSFEILLAITTPSNTASVTSYTGFFNTLSSDNTEFIVVGYELENSRFVYGLGSTTGTFWNIYGSNTIQPDTKYYIKIKVDNTTVTIQISTNGTDWITDASGTISSPLNINNVLRFGLDRSLSRAFEGTIDLKSIAVWADGVPVFSGNKTGIDVIKPDNFEVVGSPVITEDGVLTATANSYVKKNNNPFINLTQKLVIQGSMTYKKAAGENWIYCTNFYLDWSIINAGASLRCRFPELNDDGTVKQTAVYLNLSSIGNIKEGDIINFKIEFFKNSVNLILNGITTTHINLNLAFDYIKNLGLISIGNTSNAQYVADHFYTGSIDLNSFKIYVDDQLVYQPCLKIPYTLSKTGSKIVDAAYRDRVQDMYEQYGYAPYYTIDEENENFTLPAGDIYGMITKNREILDIVYPIGRPMPEENNVLLDNEVWLEGATVNIVDYPKLFKVYGTKYGGDGTTTFKLPDMRGRTLWGSPDGSNGYIEAKLPNIKGSCGKFDVYEAGGEGCFIISSQTYGNTREQWGGTVAAIGFDASLSNSIYSDDATTVQPPAFKVRWKTRFE